MGAPGESPGSLFWGFRCRFWSCRLCLGNCARVGAVAAGGRKFNEFNGGKWFWGLIRAPRTGRNNFRGTTFGMEDLRVHTCTLVADLHLRGAASLKDRRKELKSLVDRLRRDGYAVAQVGPADLLQRVFLAVSDVSGDVTHLDERMDAAERLLLESEFEVGRLERLERTWSDSSLR